MESKREFDPFEEHFASPTIQDTELSAVKADAWQWDSTTHTDLGKVERAVPKTDNVETTTSLKRKRDPEIQVIHSVTELPLKKRLIESATSELSDLPAEIRGLAVPLFDHQDVQYGGRTPENADHLRKLTALHALNHIYKTRDRILRNTERLRAAESSTNGASAPDDVQDQGFTRAKVLILLETRSMAYKYAAAITALAQPSQQENKSRFEAKFGSEEDDQATDPDLPPDYRELFAGNSDNHFIATLKFTRKTLKFFPSFADADIILASPLALHLVITKNPKKPDYDFLSSIELLIVDQADALLQQNFEHVHSVCEHLNRPLRAMSTRTDYARVRPWYLENLARHLRQTVVYSAYHTPALNGLASAHMRSLRGRVRITPANMPGSMGAAPVLDAIRQTFTRFASPSPAADADARFAFFTKTLLPRAKRRLEGASDDSSAAGAGLLLFAPSYFDFVQLRAYLVQNPDALPCEYAALDERADVKAARRVRSLFAQRRVGCLLYSGRAHHFRRYLVKGVRCALLYGVPDNPAFYPEVLKMLGSSIASGAVRADETSVEVLYSRYEIMALERVVGSARVGKMVYGKKDVFEFVP